MNTPEKKILLTAFFVFSVVFATGAFAEDIVIDQNTTWAAGTYDYNSVQVTNGATLIFNGAVILNAQDLTIDSGSFISANGTGYPAKGGPGAGGLNGVHGAGGGYGGKGGPLSGTGGPTYGSAIAPVDLGSGGGYNTGGKGGGAIRLNINTLVVNGNISANGADGVTEASGKKGGGGSGGSVYITAGQLSGSGSISANGGYGPYGGGGGGRIAIYYSTSTFQGTVESKKGTSLMAAYYGQDGTICFVDTLNNVFHSGPLFKFEASDSPFDFNEIVLDNNSTVTTNGNISLSADNLTIGNSSSLILSGDATIATVGNLNITGDSDLTLSGNCQLVVTGTVNTENSSITTAGPQSLVLPSPNITITGQSTLIWGPGLYSYDNVSITDNSSLVFNGAVTLEAPSVTIDPCSSISAKGTGYPAKGGPGAGGLNGVHGAGGGYGGKGGPLAGAGGAIYGSAKAPVDLGSGGGYDTGGKGGGAIRLNVGNLVVNGNISANGADGVTDTSGKKGGGGSGGSVYITAEQLSGSGLISANGGYGYYGGGGGGRIAIYYSTSTFQGTTASKGGTGLLAAYYGQDGTVCFVDTLNNVFYSGHSFRFGEHDSPLSYNKVILNNSKVSVEGSVTLTTNELAVDNNSTLTISGEPTAVTVVDLAISGNSEVVITGNSKLTVTGTVNLENSSIATAGPQNLTLPSEDITLATGSTLIWGPGIYAYEDILITDNSSLTFNGAVTLNATNVTVDPCCSISANGTGYPAQGGPGAGGLNGVHGAGGGYGGKGGPRDGAGGSTYGSAIAPVDLGSGGGYSMGGKGGGAIRLNIDNLVVNGNISANGADGGIAPYGNKGGGGSGGSVYITAEQLSGSGLISANGGYGSYGGGGGGRIAIYYSTSTFQGTIGFKGGTSLTEAYYGEDGSVFYEEPSKDSPITAMQSSATSLSESTLSETLRALAANLTNVEVTGDFNGVMNFSDFEVITIESGSFTGQGFAKATWQVNIAGVDYAGVWRAMATRAQTETGSTIYMKGVVSGEISGITEGQFVESANDPNVIGAYSSKWMLNRMKDQVVASPTIELSGVLSSQQTTDYPATQLYVLQGSFDANSYGHYTGPLGVVLTHVRVKDQSNAYYGEGFSMLSYISDAGQGLASSYNTLDAPGVSLLKGSCDNPLLGILNATLDESATAKRLSITIERIDFSLPPEPVLAVRIWAPSQVSPGEIVNYTIEYRNDGTKAAENVRITQKLPENVDVLSYTGDGYYRANGSYDDAPEVAWVIDNVPAQSKGYLATTVRVKWGLSELDTLRTYAMAEHYEMHFDPNITVDSTVVEANNSFVNVNHAFADGNNVVWTLNTTCLVGESTIEMNEPNLVVTATDSNFEASLEFTANPLFYVRTEGFGGASYSLDSLVETYIMKDVDKRILVWVGAAIHEREYLEWLYYNDFIDQPTYVEYLEGTKKLIVVTWDAQDIVGRFEEARDYYDYITKGVLDSLINIPADKLGEAIITYESQKAEPRIRTDSAKHAIQDTMEMDMKNYGNIGHREPNFWQSELYTRNIEKQLWLPWRDDSPYLTIKRAITNLFHRIRVALDPNRKYGPNGRVLPGQKLDYKVEFENVGEGIAFGVYFTDTLDKDVNDATLQIGPVMDANNGSILAVSGTYNPATRTITWFVGQVEPNQGGYTEFSVDVNSKAQHGTEIINYATIYFPSVPQELRTNGIVSTVLLNLPPKANAGPDQSVHVGNIVVLDGSGSTDPDEDVLTFKWAFGLRPSGSQAVLNDTNSLNPTFIPDVPGTYTVTLRVNDGQEQSQFDAIKISTVNVAPIADAGEDQTVRIGELVTLDASGSTDSDGDLLSYSWVFKSVPAGSTAVLNDPNSLNPSFVADVPGTYVVSLVVNDGMVDSEPDTVMISTVNLAPIANAGEDQAVHIGDLVTLDGSRSTDADGNPLTYRWAFTVVPEGSDANLDDPNSVNPTFTADESGTYVVSLVVNDDTEDSEADTVTISTINVAPIADAGEDQAVYVGDLVMLNGSGSWDADGDSLTYSWSFTAIPDDSTTVLNGASTAEPNFVVDVPGTYVISLVVNDDTVGSAPDVVSVSTINVAPTADAGEDQSALVGHLVSLDGSDSNDPDGDSLSYLWAFTSVPNRSAAALDDPTSANPHFTPDVPGTYVVSLVVNDGTVNSEADHVTISAATQQTQAIAMVREVIDVVNGLDKSVFKNRYLKRALTRKLNVVIHSLERRRYCIALMALKHDILGKIDGCALNGHADRNDWITNCDAQAAVYPLVVDIIDFLQ